MQILLREKTMIHGVAKDQGRDLDPSGFPSGEAYVPWDSICLAFAHRLNFRFMLKPLTVRLLDHCRCTISLDAAEQT